MEDNNRCSTYSELHKRIKGDVVDSDRFNQELKLLKKELECPDHTVQNAAISLLKELLNVNDVSIRDYIFELLESKDSLMYRSVFHVMKIYFKEMMCKDDFNFTELYKTWMIRNVKQVQFVLKEVYENELLPNQQKQFLLNNVIHTMMSPDLDNDIRNMILDVAFLLLEFSSIMELSGNELNMFVTQVTSKYIENISHLRDINYDNWHKLWIFLIRYFNKKLHNSMSLTNKLLRIVEYAFRNPSVYQRIRGYDCWKELIDNASLDRKYLCSHKQIKLLVTPLKAKFSKQEVVICKRFEVFAYLLEKLQDDLVLVLHEFLEFCFGFIGKDNLNVSRTGQAKIVPEICLQSISAFIEIIGHSHKGECLTSGILKLVKPAINCDNVGSYYQIILHSTLECCALLENCQTAVKESVLKCMWRSIFNTVLNAKEEVKEKCIVLLVNMFENLIKRKEEYYKKVQVVIFTELISMDAKLLRTVLPKFLDPVRKIYFTMDLLSDDVCDAFNTLIHNSDMSIKRKVIHSFAIYKVSDASFEKISKLWRLLLHDLVPDVLEDISFLIWPLYHNQSNSKYEIDEMYKAKLKYLEDSERLYGLLLKQLESLFKENPLFCNKIVEIFEIVGIQQGTIKNVNSALKLLASMLILPDKNGHHQHIAQIICDYLQNSDLLINSDDETIKNLCVCIERLLSIRHLALLRVLEKYFSGLDINIRRKYSKHLYNSLLDLSTVELKSDIAESVRKILSLLHTPVNDETVGSEKNFKTPKSTSRSARIANLVQANDSIKPVKSDSPLALKLFGKDLDTLSPLRVKGSLLNSSTPPRSKKIMSLASAKLQKSPLVSDEKDSDFVAINTEVKLDRHKLTENQKEALKRRREDIPALYQDLTQSSQECTTDSTSNSNSTSKHELDKKQTKDKVDENVNHFEKINEANNKNDAKEVPVESQQIVPETENSTGHTDVKQNMPEADRELLDDTQVENSQASLYDQQTEIDRKEEIVADNKIEENIANGDDIKKLKRKLRIEQELKKLSMDIVGAEEFFSPSSKRKRVRKEPLTGEDANRTEAKSEKPRKKSTGALKNISAESTPILNQKPTLSLNREVSNEPVSKLNKKTEEESKKPLKSQKEMILDDDNTPIANRIEKTEEGSKRKSRKREENLSLSKSSKKSDHTNKRNTSKERSESTSVAKVVVRKEEHTEIAIDSTPVTTQKSPKKGEQEHKRKNLIQQLLKSNKKDLNTAQNTLSLKKTLKDIDDENSHNVNNTPQRSDSPLGSNKEDPINNETYLESEIKNVEMNKLEEKLISAEDDGGIETEQNESADITEKHESEMAVSQQPSKGPSKRGKKRKRPVEQSDDEDIIESSQESVSHILQNSSVSRKNSTNQIVDNDKNVSDPENLSDKTIVNKDITIIDEKDVAKDSNKEENVIEELILNKDDCILENNKENAVPEQTPNFVDETEPEKIEETQATPQKSTQSQDTQTQDTQTQESSITPVECNMQLDLPKKPELTESEQEIAAMDTLSFNSNCLSQVSSQVINTQKSEISSSEPVDKEVPQLEAETSTHSSEATSTPPSSKNSLPTSPVTTDTPNKTSELLNDTLDISPINSPTNDEECVSSTSKEDIVNCKAELVDIKQEDDQLEINVPDEANVEPQKDVKNITERSSRMLSMVQIKSPSTISSRRLIYKRKGGINMSPSASRIKKFMCNFKSNVTESAVEDVVEEDILTFSREVPSPLAVPRSSILKRKLSETSTEDAQSPCAKRKRVNFSDPCTTSKKIFIKDDYYKERPNLEARCLFDVRGESTDDSDFFERAETITESEENIETEKSLEIENPLILRQHKPIYPGLVDCKEGIFHILKKVTSPMFRSTLNNRLKLNNIRTIGDLAKESEAAITRYPFRVPAIANVYKALDQYYNKVYKFKVEESKNQKTDDSPVSSPETGKEVPSELISDGDVDEVSDIQDDEDPVEIVEPIEDLGVVIVDSIKSTKEELKEILQRATEEKIPFEEISQIFLEFIDGDNFAKLIKMSLNTSKTTLDDILSDSDFQTVLKHFIDKHGLPKIFELLSDTVESSQDESIYFDCMIKHSIEKRPLSALLEKRSLVEIRTGLKECIEQNMFAREDLIEVCLMPLLQAPNDLLGYFNKLSVVQVESVIVSRLKGADFEEFTNDILKICGTDTVVNLMKQQQFIKYCSIEELTDTIVEKCPSSEIMSCFKKCVDAYSVTDQQAILMEMFKFASSRLSVTTLTELHIEFLRKIPKLLKVD